MPIDAWLPVGFALPDGTRTRGTVSEGPDFQIFELTPEGRALVARPQLANRWESLGLPPGALTPVSFGTSAFVVMTAGAHHRLDVVESSAPPKGPAEALAFATAMRETRRADPGASLHDAIYAERFSRLLPVWSLSAAVPDDQVLGGWLTGGVRVSALSVRRLASLVRGSSEAELRPVVEAAGLRPLAGASRMSEASTTAGSSGRTSPPGRKFSLAGRVMLEQFFSEHVIDIVENPERYRALGIEFPSAIALHGPPGSGKTFAVERVVEYLGWPSWSIDSSTIGSPYIHDTGRKIAQVFDDAVRGAPAVVYIDEMEAFLTDRQTAGSAHHRVEEVAEFLRRIPEAIKNRVLVIGMTNRIELIDPAVLRRGRFDHVIEVGMPSAEEVRALLEKLLSEIPHEDHMPLAQLVAALTGRPLSDAAFVVREGARLAARSGRKALDGGSLHAALGALPPSPAAPTAPRPIGFK